MEKWMIYGLIAEVFIALRDVFSKDMINRYDYIDYILVANIIVFICTLVYLFVSKIHNTIPNPVIRILYGEEIQDSNPVRNH